ncbi:DinB family protein [Angustibacter sp. McL0619]|uniref:DinB family protein n=1 Tax=Angustibacter sp. McL0619 TaxID=3415676 RepID=UPI003CF169FD
MPIQRVRPPLVADERTQLIGWFDLQRAIVAFKCEGLSEADAHRAVLPTSPLMTVAGIVSHLRWTEHCWFEVVFLDRGQSENPQFVQEPEDLDWMVDDVPLAQLLAEYEQQCARSNETITAHSLDDVGAHQEVGSGSASLRWMVIHMVEETARHAGHLDTVRELLDGRKGYY